MIKTVGSISLIPRAGEIRGLDHIIVGAAIQTDRAIVERVERGEHQHRNIEAAFAQLPQN